jgi:antitoxin component YwqK of YwqJK toxin-antitoxin module
MIKFIYKKLFYTFLLVSVFTILQKESFAQKNRIPIQEEDIIRLESNTDEHDKLTLTLLKKDSSRFSAGAYELKTRKAVLFLTINEQGNLQGLVEHYNTDGWLFRKSIWQNGYRINETNYNSKDVIIEEHIVDTMTVLLYDSLSNKWIFKNKKVSKENEYYENGKIKRTDIYYGGNRVLLKLYHENGKLSDNDIEFYSEEEYDAKGRLEKAVKYDWALKEKTELTYENGKLRSKLTERDRNLKWLNNGTIEFYLKDDSNAKEDKVKIDYYPNGKIEQKEITKNGEQIVMQYDKKGGLIKTDRYKIQDTYISK